ncbi:MAG: double zinc ribbon domain-containing protein [Acetobacteraceae bacterium]
MTEPSLSASREPPRLTDGARPSWLTAGLRRAGGLALDMLLPPHCALCDARVQENGQLCAACFVGTGFITGPACRRCGVPFSSAGQGGAALVCPACEEAPPLFDQAAAPFRYDAQARRLILPFKHADQTTLAPVLAQHMARAGATLLARADLLVPVPLHRWRLLHRRYNQAALLARALGRFAERRVLPDALVRRRATPSLGEMTAEERTAAVADAFAVRPRRAELLAGRRVLLIDDVMTSGATANACAAVLLHADAQGVDVLTAARVPDPRLR